MTSYQIYILPNCTDKYSYSVLHLLKEHEYSSVIITLGSSAPFLQTHVPNAFFIKNIPANENLIVEEITKRKPTLVVMDNCFSQYYEKESQKTNATKSEIDPLLSRVLHCSIQQKNIKIIQVIPLSMVNSTAQCFKMAEKIYCSKQFYQEIDSLKLNENKYNVRLFDNSEEMVLVNALPLNTPVAKITGIEPPAAKNSVHKQEFRLYQYIYTIHNRTELFLFIQHLREINWGSSQEHLSQVIAESCILLDGQTNIRKSITEEDKNEYIHKLSASIPHILQNQPTLLDEILAFFTATI